MSIRQTKKALLLEGPQEASLGLFSGCMGITHIQSPHGPPKSEDMWSEGTQGQSPRLVDLWVCLSSPLGLSFSSMDRGLVPSRQPQSYGGHHETRSQGGDFGPTGPPAPQGSSTVPTLHPHLSVRTALDWKPTSASCVSTPLAESQSFIAGGLNTTTSAQDSTASQKLASSFPTSERLQKKI